VQEAQRPGIVTGADTKGEMMKYILFAALAALLLMGLGCGKDAATTAEPANLSEYDVVNSSSRDLRVQVQPSGRETVVEAGSSMRVFVAGGTYTEFTAPSAALTCVSVFDNVAGDLVYQQSPVVNGEWSEVRGAVRVMHYALELTDADLSQVELLDNCGI
jgi:hypothetical protein